MMRPLSVSLWMLTLSCGVPIAAPSAPAQPVPSIEESPPETISALLRASHGNHADAVFRYGYGGVEVETHCGDFPACDVCQDDSTQAVCDDETYRAVCGRDRSQGQPLATSETVVSRPPDGNTAWVDLRVSRWPPSSGVRLTVFFDSEGRAIGLGYGPGGETLALDAGELSAKVTRSCAYRASLEARRLSEWERIGLFTHRFADHTGEQRRNAEAHLCGPGVPSTVRTLLEAMFDPGFDGCELVDESLSCWVFGHESHTVFVAQNRGSEQSPRMEVVAIYEAGMLLSDEAEQAQEKDIQAFLERVRRNKPRRAGRPFLMPDPLPSGVKPCR